MIYAIAQTFDGKPVAATFPLYVDRTVIDSEHEVCDARHLTVVVCGDRETADSIVAILNAAHAVVHGAGDSVGESEALGDAVVKVAGGIVMLHTIHAEPDSEIDVNGRDCDGVRVLGEKL